MRLVCAIGAMSLCVGAFAFGFNPENEPKAMNNVSYKLESAKAFEIWYSDNVARKVANPKMDGRGEIRLLDIDVEDTRFYVTVTVEDINLGKISVYDNSDRILLARYGNRMVFTGHGLLIIESQLSHSRGVTMPNAFWLSKTGLQELDQSLYLVDMQSKLNEDASMYAEKDESIAPMMVLTKEDEVRVLGLSSDKPMQQYSDSLDNAWVLVRTDLGLSGWIKNRINHRKGPRSFESTLWIFDSYAN